MDTFEKIRAAIRGETPLDEAETKFLLDCSGLEILFHIPDSAQYIERPLAFNSLLTKVWYKTCRELLEELKCLPYAVIKGAVLSARIHDNAAVRISNDLDILIAPRDIDIVKSIFQKHGFIQGRVVNSNIVPYTRKELIYQKALTHQLAPFCKKTGHALWPIVSIDINTDIFWGESIVKADMPRFLQNCEDFTIYDTSLRRLTPVYEFISLCMHHYKDLNSLYLLWERGVSLLLFSDIYYYILRVRPDLDELKSVCKSFRVTDYVYFCLYHTNVIFEDETLKAYMSVFEPVADKNILMRIGLSENEYRYLPKGISEYLLDQSFKNTLNVLITDEDRRKIELNREFM